MVVTSSFHGCGHRTFHAHPSRWHAFQAFGPLLFLVVVTQVLPLTLFSFSLVWPCGCCPVLLQCFLLLLVQLFLLIVFSSLRFLSTSVVIASLLASSPVGHAFPSAVGHLLVLVSLFFFPLPPSLLSGHLCGAFLLPLVSPPHHRTSILAFHHVVISHLFSACFFFPAGTPFPMFHRTSVFLFHLPPLLAFHGLCVAYLSPSFLLRCCSPHISSFSSSHLFQHSVPHIFFFISPGQVVFRQVFIFTVCRIPILLFGDLPCTVCRQCFPPIGLLVVF